MCIEGAGLFRDASQAVVVRTERVGTSDVAGVEETVNWSLVLFDSGDGVTF